MAGNDDSDRNSIFMEFLKGTAKDIELINDKFDEAESEGTSLLSKINNIFNKFFTLFSSSSDKPKTTDIKNDNES